MRKKNYLSDSINCYISSYVTIDRITQVIFFSHKYSTFSYKIFLIVFYFIFYMEKKCLVKITNNLLKFTILLPNAITDCKNKKHYHTFNIYKKPIYSGQFFYIYSKISY